MKNLFLSVVFFFTIIGNSFSQWEYIDDAANAGNLCSIHFIDSQRGFLSNGGRTWDTFDGGFTWTKNEAQGFRDFGFYDDKLGYGISFVGMNMAKTINGGDSWTSITPPNSTSLWAVSAPTPSVVYFAGAGGTIHKTTNGAISVFEMNSPSNATLTDIIFPEDEDTGYLVAHTGEIYKTTSEGIFWNEVKTFETEFLNEAHFVNEDLGFVVGSSGTVTKTSDGGNTWTELNTNTNVILQGINFFDEDHGIAVGFGGTIIYTNDGGDNWDVQNSGTEIDLYDVRMISPISAIVIGDEGIILKNTNVIVGVENVELDTDLNLYPNPTSGMLTVSMGDFKITEIQIIDKSGQTMKHVKTSSNSIDVSELAEGVYYAKIITTKGFQHTRFMKL